MSFAFIFPGQGSQKIGMGKDFFDNSKNIRNLFDEISDVLKVDFKKLLFEENDLLNKTEFSQPAIFLTSICAYRVFLENLNIKPDFMLGHSLGELSSVSASGGFDIHTGVKLVHKRGLLMNEACEKKQASMMVVLGLDDDLLKNFCDEKQKENKKVWVANYNSVGQVVLAGIKDDLESIEVELKSLGAKRSMLLNMSVASHCPLLSDAVLPFKDILNTSLSDNFLTPIISNVNAKTYNTKKEALELLSEQLVSPVLYRQSISQNDDKVDCYIEFGADILKGLNKRNSKRPTLSITDMKSLDESLKYIEKDIK